MNIVKCMLSVSVLLLAGSAAIAQLPTTKKTDFPWNKPNLFQKDNGLIGQNRLDLTQTLTPPAEAPAKPENVWEWVGVQWNWYWNEKAQLPETWLGNHMVGRTVLAVWNGLMRVMILRGALCLFVVMGIGAAIRDLRKK